MIHNATKGKIRRLRRYGFRLWSIAAEVKQPEHKVAGVLVKSGTSKLCEFDRKFEVARSFRMRGHGSP